MKIDPNNLSSGGTHIFWIMGDGNWLYNSVSTKSKQPFRFPTTCVHHLEAFHFDHRPIILVFDSQLKRFYRKGRLFRLEVMWLKDKSCENIIKNLWVSLLEPSPVRVLTKKNSIC